MDCQALLGSMDYQGALEVMDYLEEMEYKVLKGHKEYRDLQEKLDLQVLKEIKDKMKTGQLKGARVGFTQRKSKRLGGLDFASGARGGGPTANLSSSKGEQQNQTPDSSNTAPLPSSRKVDQQGEESREGGLLRLRPRGTSSGRVSERDRRGDKRREASQPEATPPELQTSKRESCHGNGNGFSPRAASGRRDGGSGGPGVTGKRLGSVLNARKQIEPPEGDGAILGHIFPNIMSAGEKLFASSAAEGNYETAKVACSHFGGQIASPRNEAENNAIVKIIAKLGKSAFLGMNDIETEGNFIHLNGEHIGYTNWAPGEPNSAQEDCIEIYTYGKWNDKSCAEIRIIVCEFLSN
ncbi:pulmonary surfactant-associated protein D [Anolis carolinensis]|uniref:pulmonary surfactant-associated protein D n=1 Tax=Anolis carolinensis TaxID=28377 RepID=UPI002F2B74FC